MLVVETIARIRREHFIKGKTIKEIARDLKVSRNTVRKVLRSGETSFEYEREVQPRPKLGRWASELDGLLAVNAAKSAREQLTLIRIFEELRGRGYDGGYDAVRRYARRWSKERGQSAAAAYVPLSFAPGEACQFDLEPRGGSVERDHYGREGRPCPASATAACCWYGPIHERRRRWCSTPSREYWHLGAPFGSLWGLTALSDLRRL